MSNLLKKITKTMNNNSARLNFQKSVSESRKPLSKEYLNNYEDLSEQITKFEIEQKKSLVEV